MTEEILKRVDALAAKLGVAATQLWAVLVHQARVRLITDVVELFLFAALGFGLVQVIRKTTRHIYTIQMGSYGTARRGRVLHHQRRRHDSADTPPDLFPGRCR